MIDSTVLRAHQHACCWRGSKKSRAIGRLRGGLTTKMHVIVTPEWHLAAHAFSPGHTADIRVAPRVLVQLGATQGAHLVGDRAYDCDAWLQQLKERRLTATIPAKRNRRHPRPWSKARYRSRHTVENFFARIKHLRRLGTRYDKRVPMLRAFLHAAVAVITTRRTIS